MYRRILVPVNGSDAACQGLAEAIRLAVPWGSTLRLLHVTCAYPFAVEMANPADVEGYRRSLNERASSVLGAASSAAHKAGLVVETQVRELTRERPASAIVEEASSSDCDLIVMGTHGRSGLDRAVAGSNAEDVVRRSPVPVLVVHRTKVSQRRPRAQTSTAAKARGGDVSALA